MKRWINATVLLEDGAFHKTTVTTEGGIIRSVGGGGNADEVIDCAGKYLLPGLVDIHTHGRAGYDFTTATAEQMKRMKKDYARHGVTSLFPTLASATPEQWKRAIANIAVCGFAGVHLEGRYLNPSKRGAHAPELLAPPDPAELEEVLSGNTLPCHLTAAWELDADGAFAACAKQLGATLSLGHTMATTEETLLAIRRGVTCFTHLCNAMPPLHHRAGGAVCTALTSDVYAELIVDGIHVCPEMVRLIYQCKGKDRLILITDSMEATGCPDGVYSIAGQEVFVRNGRAETADGALAGSTLDLWDGVKNLMRFASVSLEDAVRCATLNPARAVGIDKNVGGIAPGKKADLLLVNRDLEIEAVLTEEQIVRL